MDKLREAEERVRMLARFFADCPPTYLVTGYSNEAAEDLSTLLTGLETARGERDDWRTAYDGAKAERDEAFSFERAAESRAQAAEARALAVEGVLEGVGTQARNMAGRTDLARSHFREACAEWADEALSALSHQKAQELGSPEPQVKASEVES